MIAVYVDDMVIAGKNERKIADIKEAFSSRFNVKDMGELHYFLGFKIIQEQNSVLPF